MSGPKINDFLFGPHHSDVLVLLQLAYPPRSGLSHVTFRLLPKGFEFCAGNRQSIVSCDTKNLRNKVGIMEYSSKPALNCILRCFPLPNIGVILLTRAISPSTITVKPIDSGHRFLLASHWFCEDDVSGDLLMMTQDWTVVPPPHYQRAPSASQDLQDGVLTTYL